MKLQLVIQKGADKEAPAPKPKPTEEELQRLRDSMGPFERVYFYDSTGVKWRTYVAPRILEEYFNENGYREANGRYTKVPFRWRRAVGILIGAAGGLVVGSIAWIILLLGGVFSPTSWILWLVVCILGGILTGAIFPGIWIGKWIFKSPPAWYIRRIESSNGKGQLFNLSPIINTNYSGDRYTGEIRVNKTAEGNVQIELPEGLMGNSARAMYITMRAKALIKMWVRKFGLQMQKITTGAMLVIAVCTVAILFIVGYTQISGRGGGTTEKDDTTSTSIPTPIVQTTNGGPDAR